MIQPFGRATYYTAKATLATYEIFSKNSLPISCRPAQYVTDDDFFYRSGYFGVVPSLVEICVRTLQENVDDIAECGGLPYSVLKPVLERAQPQTLMQVRRVLVNELLGLVYGSPLHSVR